MTGSGTGIRAGANSIGITRLSEMGTGLNIRDIRFMRRRGERWGSGLLRGGRLMEGPSREGLSKEDLLEGEGRRGEEERSVWYTIEP